MSRALSYIIILCLTFVFTYIFDVNENYILLYILIMLPLFDGITFIYFKVTTKARVNIINDTAVKGQKINCNIKLINKGILPIPFVDYRIVLNGRIKVFQEISERRSLGIREVYENSLDLFAIHIGIGEINIENLEIRSLFGLFKGKISCTSSNNKITIIPRLVDIDGMDKLIEDTQFSEDEDSNQLFQGEPGYDYKDYSEGDPLSRVNWKLSSKKNKLVIRKSLGMVKCKKIIVLDQLVVADDNFYETSDLLIEGLIGIASELDFMDYEVQIFIKNNNKWQGTILSSSKIIEELQRNFSKYTFSQDEKRFQGLSFYDEEKYDVILITSNKDEGVLNFISNIEEGSNSVEIISNNRTKLMAEEFYLLKDYELERL